MPRTYMGLEPWTPAEPEDGRNKGRANYIATYGSARFGNAPRHATDVSCKARSKAFMKSRQVVYSLIKCKKMDRRDQEQQHTKWRPRETAHKMEYKLEESYIQAMPESDLFKKLRNNGSSATVLDSTMISQKRKQMAVG
jgi:hypothetical protein